MHNLINRVKLFLAPDGAGSGSAGGGTPAASGAEETLADAFNGGAGADGTKPEAKPGEGDKAAGGEKPGSETKLAAWTEQLPPEIRGNPDFAAKIAKFAKVGDMAKAFLELEGKAANGGIPGKDASAEEAAAFWEKAGRPKTAGEYAFAKDKENGGELFAQAAHLANLTSSQAEAMYKNLNAMGKQRTEALNREAANLRRETAEALKTEYGSKYTEKMELLKRGLAAAGPNVGKILGQAGLDYNPEIVKAFIAYGEMTAESGAARGAGAAGTLISVEDGGAFDYET